MSETPPVLFTGRFRKHERQHLDAFSQPQAGAVHRLRVDMDYGMQCVNQDGRRVVALVHDGKRWWPICEGCTVTPILRSAKCLADAHEACQGCHCTCHEEHGPDVIVVARLLAKALTHRDSHLVVRVVKQSNQDHVELRVLDTVSRKEFSCSLNPTKER